MQTQLDETGKEALEKLAEDHVGMFTLHALWNAMPLDLFLQCVGSALRSPEIPRLVEANQRLGAALPEGGEILEQDPGC